MTKFPAFGPEIAGMATSRHSCPRLQVASLNRNGLHETGKSTRFTRIRKMMRTAVIFDGRNIYNPEQIRSLGFTYYSIGRR